jgi:FkbM family methyltransferase
MEKKNIHRMIHAKGSERASITSPNKPMKRILKQVTPPLIFSAFKKILQKPATYTPVWNTFSYAPMEKVTMYFDPKGPWQQKLLSDKYDAYIFNRLKSLNLSGKTIFDVGAHIGFHSFYFSQLVGSKGKVYAFEPHPKNLERIQLCINENKNKVPTPIVVGIALSKTEGVIDFTLNNDIESGRSSGGFIENADTIWEKAVFTNRGFTKTKVKTLPLDELKKIGISAKPNIIKIDVEGAEALVLRGGQKTILSHKPLIFLEVHSIKAMFEVMDFFKSVSYNTEIIHEEKDGRCFLEAKPQ